MEILYFDGGAIHGNDGYACALAKGTVDASEAFRDFYFVI